MRRLAAALAATLLLVGTATAAPSAMPLVEVPASMPGDTLVVFYSGDGGWAPLDRSVASQLADRGLAVVGVNSLRYFLTRREPQAAATELAEVVAHYSRAWNRPKLVLAGYSWGADFLPLLADRLPPALRQRVRLVAMISPEEKAELQVHLGDWLGNRSPDAVPLSPVLAQIRELRTLCIYGADEAKPGCPAFAGLVDKTVKLPGSHHLGGRYDLVAAAIAGSIG